MDRSQVEFARARTVHRWLGFGGFVALPVLLSWPLDADPRIAAVVFVAALTSSIIGFAFAALAGAPLLLLADDPLQTVTVVVACSIATQAYGVWSLRRSLAWRALLPFVAGGMPAVPAGVWLLAHTPSTGFALGLGLLVTLYAAYRLWNGEARPRRSRRWLEVVVGALGGVAGGFAGLSGMFLVMWCGMRGLTKECQRSLYQPYILAMQVEALACLRVQAPGAFSSEIFLLYVPLALVAASAGVAIFRRLSGRQFHLAVNVVLLASGIALVGPAALALGVQPEAQTVGGDQRLRPAGDA